MPPRLLLETRTQRGWRDERRAGRRWAWTEPTPDNAALARQQYTRDGRSTTCSRRTPATLGSTDAPTQRGWHGHVRQATPPARRVLSRANLLGGVVEPADQDAQATFLATAVGRCGTLRTRHINQPRKSTSVFTTRGVASCERPRWHVAGDDSTRCYHGTVADSHALQDCRIHANPHVVANHYGTRLSLLDSALVQPMEVVIANRDSPRIWHRLPIVTLSHATIMLLPAVNDSPPFRRSRPADKNPDEAAPPYAVEAATLDGWS